MILQGHYCLCALFVILLTIVLYGLGKVVIKMAFGELSEDKAKLLEAGKQKLSAFMYIPQIIMLVMVFVLGIYIPTCLNEIIKLAAGAF